MSLGFTARETIPIVFFGFAICSVVITATGKMGATYHVPFPVIVCFPEETPPGNPLICVVDSLHLWNVRILSYDLYQM
jgi:nucleobase:cation symporter-1, NCS1 family